MTQTLIVSILERMAELIQHTSSLDWLHPLESLRLEAITDEKEAARRIIRLYGGAGSLNDIVLYDGTALLVAETTEFSTLRKKLFETCKTAL